MYQAPPPPRALEARAWRACAFCCGIAVHYPDSKMALKLDAEIRGNGLCSHPHLGQRRLANGSIRPLVTAAAYIGSGIVFGH